MKPVYEKVPARETSSFYAYKKTLQSFEFGWHYHPEYEITAITAGSGKRYAGDSIDEYNAPQIVLLPPNLSHSWQSQPSETVNTAIVVQFSGEFIEKAGLNLPEFSSIKRMLALGRGGLCFGADRLSIEIMELAAATDGLESYLHLIWLLHRLADLKPSVISVCAASSSVPPMADCDNINRLFNYINGNFTGEITLGQAAKTVCMSRSSFCRFFKKLSGRRFVEHINDLRVSMACKLLAETDMDVTQICFKSGFTNLANFNRQFKRRKGQSPRRYRLLHN